MAQCSERITSKVTCAQYTCALTRVNTLGQNFWVSFFDTFFDTLSKNGAQVVQFRFFACQAL